MPENPTKRLDPTQPMPPEAVEFTRRVNTMLDGTSRDESTVAEALAGFEGMFDVMAAGLYNFASMLVGQGEESMLLVEAAVANADVNACTEPEDARRASRLALVSAALQTLAIRNPAGLAAPREIEPAQTCIEDDDLSSAGVSREELDQMMSGPDRERVRTWLESLPVATRTIFVLRAVGGYSTPETAALLAEFGGPQAAGWSPDAIRELFRQGLCSLASQLIHAGSKH